MSFKEELDSFRRRPGNHAFQESHINQHSQLPCTVPQLRTSQPKLQHRLSLMHHEFSHRNFLSSVSSALKASLLSNRQYGASLCFNIPSCPELVISNEVFQFFVQSHLCVRLLSDNQGPLHVCHPPRFPIQLSCSQYLSHGQLPSRWSHS